MIQKRLLAYLRAVVLGGLVVSLPLKISSQTFSGTNAPGDAQDFPITVGAGATNLSITVGGSATAYSHLLLKLGAPPSDTDFDFIAALDGQTNAINLELPELQAGGYVLRVKTPSSSLTHSFTVNVATNQTNLRSAARPATKPIESVSQGSLVSGTWHYFRVDIVTNISGWRILLNSTNSLNPDLYVQRGALPTAAAFLKRSQALANDGIALVDSELPPGTYFIGVFQPAQPAGTGTYTLQTEFITFTTLNWDSGATHLGTEVYTHPATNGGDFYFKITTQNTALGAWRTALVVTGEANIYLTKGAPPTVGNFQYKSDRVGSDGFVLPSAAFNAGEDWYYMVRAEPGAQWNLVTGEPFVADLGDLATDGSSGSGEVSVGAEGIRFFKTSVPANTVAWRLWLNGLTNQVMVRRTSLPVPTQTDLTQSGQMLVVPSYLSGGQLYFVGVAGNPGAAINLDSRQHGFVDIPLSSVANLSVTGFPYSTFRVFVPSNQIAWQVNVVVSNGNPNIAVRRNFVPNESNNDAFSEAPGAIADSITLVPAPPGSAPGTPGLGDGAYFITVYGTNAHIAQLQSGNPVITDIDFVSNTTNDDTNRVGWRFFRVSDISQQLGALGWDLFLTNHAPGTRIALRRNAVPGIWNYRNPSQTAAGVHDYLSTADFLQRPRHQADVWYVGVYSATNPLSGFTLTTRALTADPVDFDSGVATRVSVPPGKWQFFRVDVPTNALGWDIRIKDVGSGSPQLIVRRDALPESLVNLGFVLPITPTNWVSGNQWAAANDWTDRNFSHDGAIDESGRILTVGMRRPLEAGTYYVGVINKATDAFEMSYTVQSRGIGPGMALPVTDIDYVGGSAANPALAPRDIAFYRVTVPTNSPSWKVRLAANLGDASLIVARDAVPNITAARSGSATNQLTAGKRMTKLGNEHFVLIPGLQAAITPGTYYLAVMADGVVSTNNARIGTGDSSYVLQSIGPMPEIDLGMLEFGDIVANGQSLEGGESIAYHFSNQPDTLGFEISLENTMGTPVAVSSCGALLANPGPGEGSTPYQYGNEGGFDSVFSPNIITVADPCPIETIMVKARGSGLNFSNANYTLRVRRLVPEPLAFDGGAITASPQVDAWRFYKVEVPNNAVGWDIRLTDVSGGSPNLVVCRDFLAIFTSTAGFLPGQDDGWPSGARWAAASDWTQRTFTSDGAANENNRILAMGMGRPLTPGTYYVSVRNNSSPSPINYTIRSRGIGEGFNIPVTELAFDGGTVTNTSLAPREAAYYRVVMPPGASSWRTKLTATVGEVMLLALTNSAPSVLTGRPQQAGKAMQKTGDEHFVMLPVSPQTALSPITNYLAVVSEGLATTNASRIGPGTSDYVLQSLGELPVIDLGQAGGVDLVHSATVEGGQVAAYQFSVASGISSLEVSLENRTNNPVIVLRGGAFFPNPGAASSVVGTGSVGADDYGQDGGYVIIPADGNANTTQITVPNPTNTIYTVLVKARGVSGVYSNATYTLRVRALTLTALTFDGGTSIVTNQTPGTWRYFTVEVPPTALGWDVRLLNVSTGLPKVVVCRDTVPTSLLTGPWSNPGAKTNWPTANQWAAGLDWTRRKFSADNTVDQEGRILAMGMGQPLEPGTYYIGVINPANDNRAMSYTIQSRGIGDGLSLPVLDLAFNGGNLGAVNLQPREAAYYRVNISSGNPSWKLKLAPSVGEAMLVILKGVVPNVDTGVGIANPGKVMQKAGDEEYVLLPSSPQGNLDPGIYYLAAVSEGQNPASVSRIGSGTSSFTNHSFGSAPVPLLGTVGAADLVQPDVLDGGETKFYQFTVPTNIPALELRLEDRVGNPTLILRRDSRLVDPSAPAPFDAYGVNGGYPWSDVNTNIITVPAPTNGTYTLAVKARVSNLVYPDANYTLRVRQVPVPELNFTPEQNTNGLSNVGGGLLLNDQRAFFKVVVPTNVNGSPVIGWELNLAQSSGQATLRVRKDALPSDAVIGMPFTSASAIIASPFLTNGTWYVEVRGNSTIASAFTLTSKQLLLQRPAWQMPGPGEPTTTPGLTAPNFGDTGLDTNGIALPADQGIDLQQGYSHYYAVIVPTNNAGLMRVQLEGISGNPDFYLRTNFVPTVSHNNIGQNGTLVDRTLNGLTTDYANWVPLNGKAETKLTPGIWYLAIKASGSATARYRLRLSVGNVTDLAIDGGSLTNQSVAGSDWRYYRVPVPQDAPTNWFITFSQQSGDVVLHVRDTVPPGNGISTNATEYRDWVTDGKNSTTNPSFDPPGTHNLTVPPVRPGTVYYLGFRAKNDATFSVSSSMGGSLPLLPTIEFYGGSVTNNLLPNSQVSYRIFAPADATRWRHSSIHSNAVQLYMENGTLPAKSINDDWRSAVANSSLNQYLSIWPWVANVSYFLTVTNTSAVTQPFYLLMDGRNAGTDDNDTDGILDYWEYQYFGNLNQNSGNDFDFDGVSNLNEYLEGTNPTNNTSLRPRLFVLATNGVVNINPSQTNYTYGDAVTLTAVPNVGYVFVRWSGSLVSTQNPVNLVMNGSKTNVANFRVPGDDFIQRVPIAGSSASVAGSNVGATKELGEANHAAGAGSRSVWWTWTASVSGQVTITTAGSNFRNALAVYTGSTVSNLTLVASNLAPAGTNTAQLTFAASAGTTYQIAVDGVAATSGSIVLNLTMPGVLILASPTRPTATTFGFTVLSSAGQPIDIYGSTNFSNWTLLTNLINSNGVYQFIDLGATNYNRRFYRVLSP